MPYGVQIGHGGVDSHAAQLVQGQHPDAVGLRVVHVWEVGVAGGNAGLVEGLYAGQEGL